MSCSQIEWYLCRISETDESTTTLYKGMSREVDKYKKYYKVIVYKDATSITFSRYNSPILHYPVYWATSCFQKLNGPACGKEFEGIVDMK